ncbi:hypothetical protein [Acidisphaera sp. L21]|uniref:hypothetical protein n=1 Tax=Acidisphaera sp. L21 TaxID=1641851 RepID=UPI00131BD2AC|nr:hypothetical protein [Acidisphaera sp. L21]
MQGADRVNEELEVGFDQRFERLWRRAEQVGRWIMVLFVAAGIAGFLGRGPYSHETAKSIGTGLTVDFEPVTRSQAGTQVTFNLDNASASSTIDIFVGTNIVEPMGLQRIEPQPLQTRLVDGGMVMTIPVAPGTRDAKLRLMLQPMSLGPNELVAQREGYAAQRWTLFVLP